MSSKVSMSRAIHRTEGEVSVEDVELDLSLRYDLVCEYCGIPVSFVEGYIRNDKYVSSYFKLKKGFKEHNFINGKPCDYNLTNANKIKVPSSKAISGYVDENDLLFRVNIPIELDEKMMEFLSNEQVTSIKQQDISKQDQKNSPGEYEKSKKSLPNYFNSAKALSVLAKLSKIKDRRLTEFQLRFFGVTAFWKDIYFEDWDLFYSKLKSKQPKEVYCIRGLCSSISKKTYKDKNEYEWVFINLKKQQISDSTKKNSETYVKIQLFQPMFKNLLKRLEKAKEESNEIAITFFGKVEKYTVDENQNIKGIAVLRKQVHFEKIK